MDNDQFQRNLQLMGQGLQLRAAAEANRIAQETAAATKELLRSQEQKIALEQALEQQRVAAEQQRLAAKRQRLAPEQQRLQEERHRNQLILKEHQLKNRRTKALEEWGMSVRTEMRKLKEEVCEFEGFLSKSGDNPQLIRGGLVATYQFFYCRTN
jgi:hypothetical protein